MERKRTAKRDDEAQSKRFIDMAREIGADAGDEEQFERVFMKVVPPKQTNTKPKKRRNAS